MKRRNFLKRLFATGVGAALASVPAIAKVKEEETFTLDDMFEPCDGNKNLFYLKTDSWLESEIRNELGDRFVDERYSTISAHKKQDAPLTRHPAKIFSVIYGALL